MAVSFLEYSQEEKEEMFSRHRLVRLPGSSLVAMGSKRYYVYIIASKSRVIYVGMTGFLMPRILQHRAGEGGQFSSKYRVHRLVYYEGFEHVETAIRRETEIKKWRREKKVALIERDNPTWEDLAADWGKPVEMTYKPTAPRPVA